MYNWSVDEKKFKKFLEYYRLLGHKHLHDEVCVALELDRRSKEYGDLNNSKALDKFFVDEAKKLEKDIFKN